MRFRCVALLLLTCPAATAAEQRMPGVTSFTELRVEGPFEVQVATGRSPSARITGERRAIEAVDIRSSGSRLVVRRVAGLPLGEDRGAATPVVVTLATPALSSVTLLGSARVSVDRVKGAAVVLSVNGGGALTLGTVDGDRIDATLVGTGTIGIAGGRAATARFTLLGNGTIEAPALDTGDLTARLDGQGSIDARARYTANAVNTGLGVVTVAGRPRCITRGSTGPVRCGASARP